MLNLKGENSDSYVLKNEIYIFSAFEGILIPKNKYVAGVLSGCGRNHPPFD